MHAALGGRELQIILAIILQRKLLRAVDSHFYRGLKASTGICGQKCLCVTGRFSYFCSFIRSIF